jgi:hypothetical protein
VSRRNVYDGDTFTHRGYSFKVTHARDEFMGEPWKEHDGHGEVSEWTSRDKAPGERVLIEDRGRSRRYYDVAGAVRTARRDQWGAVCCASCGQEAGGIGTPAYGTVHAIEPADHPFVREPRGATAARAVEADFKYLRGWCLDEWSWTCVDVVLLDERGRATDERESLGGIDGDHDGGKYLTEVAYELADEIVSRLEVAEPDVIKSVN